MDCAPFADGIRSKIASAAPGLLGSDKSMSPMPPCEFALRIELSIAVLALRCSVMADARCCMELALGGAGGAACKGAC